MSETHFPDYYSPTLFAAIGITDTNLYTGIYGLIKGEDISSSQE